MLATDFSNKRKTRQIHKTRETDEKVRSRSFQRKPNPCKYRHQACSSWISFSRSKTEPKIKPRCQILLRESVRTTSLAQARKSLPRAHTQAQHQQQTPENQKKANSPRPKPQRKIKQKQKHRNCIRTKKQSLASNKNSPKTQTQ